MLRETVPRAPPLTRRVPHVEEDGEPTTSDLHLIVADLHAALEVSCNHERMMRRELFALREKLRVRDEELIAALAMSESQRQAIETLKVEIKSRPQRLGENIQSSVSPIVRVSRSGRVFIN